jgi:hypothetical protein
LVSRLRADYPDFRSPLIAARAMLHRRCGSRSPRFAASMIRAAIVSRTNSGSLLS